MLPYASEHKFRQGLDDGKKFFIGFFGVREHDGAHDVNNLFPGEKKPEIFLPEAMIWMWSKFFRDELTWQRRKYR
jgi:hypothetical protein